MRDSPLTPAFDSRTHASYVVRVRGTPTTPTYLWGSGGVTVTPPTTFDKPLVLHIRNNVFGQSVTFGTQAGGASGPFLAIGTLQPGECYSIPIQSISGVYATCAGETNVDCLINHAQ
jgi:hypothetical protein